MVKIAITGFPNSKNAVEIVNEGADGHIWKLFDVEKLLEMIRKHLKRETDENISTRMEFDQDRARKSEIDRNNEVKRKSFFEPRVHGAELMLYGGVGATENGRPESVRVWDSIVRSLQEQELIESGELFHL